MSKKEIRSSLDLVIVSLLGILVIVSVVLLNGNGLTGATTFEACYDSDPEEDYYVKGHAEYGTKKFEDTCSSDGNRLLQAHCKTSVKASMLHSYTCPYGCREGACIANNGTTPEYKIKLSTDKKTYKINESM